MSKDKRQFEKVFMSFDRDRDPLLVIWQAMNLLDEINVYLDAPQIKKLLSDAEGLVCRLSVPLAQQAEASDSSDQPSEMVSGNTSERLSQSAI